MTGWTEPPAPTAESQKIFMAEFGAADPGKALLQVTAVYVVMHNLRYNTAKKTMG